MNMVQFKPGVFVKKITGELLIEDCTIIVDANAGTYYQFNATAFELVECLMKYPRDEAINRMTEMFDQDREIIEKDIDAIRQDLVQRNLIEIVP